jgi:Asp-tRNA(Asn)/Glu-tRNA(Gln) amidotransferase A subunit family amidase
MQRSNPKALIILGFLASFTLGSFLTLKAPALITKDMADKAAQVLGLSFTEAELDSSLAKLNDYREGYERVRKIPLTNDVAPALYFNPLPVGFEIDKVRKPFQYSPIMKATLPKDKNELAFYTIPQLASLLRSRQISSEELTKYYLERLKKYDPKLHCVISLTEDLALTQARKADEEIKAGKYRGLLHGIPYGAKDLLAKKGYKTTWGAMPYKDQTLDMDATVIKKLEGAGAVLCAKLTLGALAMGDVWFGGRTRNPWDLESGSSGSSAGSASAVSAGLLPFAIGTETLGSIVSPSTVCGTTGLRPTFGRVSRHGAMALSWSMDKIGPICRSVEDCALVFNAIYGPDGYDPTLIDAPFNYAPQKSLKGMRVGYLKKAFESNYANRANDSLTLVELKKLGVELVPMELPSYPARDMTMVISVEGAAAFDEMTRSGKDDLLVRQDKNAWPNAFRSARFVPAVEYLQANRLRAKLIQDMYETIKTAQVDVYVSPSYGGNNLAITNLTGHPCVVLPNGFNQRGTPTSITFMGQLLKEDKVLAVAKAYQDATDFHRKHPPLVK